jgi:hypothetical protein
MLEHVLELQIEAKKNNITKNLLPWCACLLTLPSVPIYYCSL